MENAVVFSFDPGISLRRPLAAPSPSELKAAFDRVVHEDELQNRLRIQQQQRKRSRQRHPRQQIREIRGDRPWRKPKKKSTQDPSQEHEEIKAEDEEGDEIDVVRDLETKLDSLVSGDIKKDSAIYVPVLRSCASSKNLRLGIRVHEHLRRSGHGLDSFLGNFLVQMYGRCGNIDLARGCFESIPFKNVFSWNMIITANAQNGHCLEAFVSFRSMLHSGVRADKITFLAALDACVGLAAIDLAREIHALLEETRLDDDLAVANSLVNAYAKCGRARDARTVFDRIAGNGDVVSWNSMIAACDPGSAIDLLRRMDSEGIKPTRVTFLAAMAGECDGAAAAELLWRVRHAVLDRDVAVATGLIRLYGRLGRADVARAVFDGLEERDVVAWTAMVAAYARSNRGGEALEIFKKMDLEGVMPNKVTMLSAMEVCSCIGSLAIARDVYHAAVDREAESSEVENAGIGMFGRCGCVESARAIFDAMGNRRNLISYTGMILACACNGQFGDAEELFRIMQLQGHVPDEVSFACSLFALNHAGLLHHGRDQFVSMRSDYGIVPSIRHYACLDL